MSMWINMVLIYDLHTKEDTGTVEDWAVEK